MHGWVAKGTLVFVLLATPMMMLGSRAKVLEAAIDKPVELASIPFVAKLKQRASELIGNQTDHVRRNWISLASPSLERWKPKFQNTNQGNGGNRWEGRADRKEYPLSALAIRFDAPIFDKTGKGRNVIGRIRRGNLLPARQIGDPKEQCYDEGRYENWYETPNGFVCGAGHFEVVAGHIELGTRQVQADVTKPSPFSYARVINPKAPRFSRPPSRQELEELNQAIERNKKLPGFVIEIMAGDFFIAIDRTEQHDGTKYFRTVHGEYVKTEDVEVRDPIEFYGEKLDTNHSLPLGFVYETESLPLYRQEGKNLRQVGVAAKHARFAASRKTKTADQEYVETKSGLLTAAEFVRVARRVERPQGVPENEKWVHFNLSTQTFVAYEGDTPVYASLFSSGKEGHTTPTGLYRTKRKYITTTMRGRNPDKSIYHVEEVPWSMFYRGGYAVHGAYWHDDFGKVRSHGCTNLSPADARWLYHWAPLKVPPGWNARTDRLGAWFYFTSDSDEQS